MNAALHAMAARAEPVTVSLEYPERNSPFMIFGFDNHELPSGRVASGFIVELHDQDPRHLLTKFTGTEVPSFEAFCIADHEVLIKKPSTSFTFLRDEVAEQKGLAAAGVLEKPSHSPSASLAMP